MEDQDDVRLESIILKYFIIGALFLTGCSVEKEPVATTPGAKATWVEIKPLVENHCVNCHNGVKHPLNLSTETAFRNSNSRARIENDTMPKDGKLDGVTKAKLLSYF